MYVQLKYVLDDDKNARAIYISYNILYTVLLQLRILTKKNIEKKFS